MPPAIRIEDLTKDYWVGFWRKRPYRALERLSLEVQGGEIFGFLGPNGAGKTTTLKLLMQLIFPTSGRAEILGRPVGDVSARQRIGYLPENPSFYDYLTAEELLQYFAQAVRFLGRRRAQARGDAPRPRRHRPRAAAAAAAQVFEGHDPARRHRAGAAERPGSHFPGRADVGPRSARPPRRALAHPGAARSGTHGVLQLAHPRRRRGACAAASRWWPAAGWPRRDASADILAFQVRGWELVIDNLQPRGARQDCAAADEEHRDLAGPLRARSAARRRPPSGCSPS